MSNAEKSRQLGMPFGTATHRLRKNVMFMLAQKCGLDICFKCNERITTSEDLSIEHKEPWLHIDISRFWDLGNITFSHLRCNVSEIRRKRVSVEEKRKAAAARMRKYYTTDKRRIKKETTGW